MFQVNSPGQMDWDAKNLNKTYESWLKQVKLYFEFQKFDGEGADDAAKAANVLKKRKNMFLYLLGEKSMLIYESLEIKDDAGTWYTGINPECIWYLLQAETDFDRGSYEFSSEEPAFRSICLFINLQLVINSKGVACSC